MLTNELLDYLGIQIENIKRNDAPLLVAIDGVDTAGKTTLQRKLAEYLRQRGNSVIQASIDGFHNPAEKRYRQGSRSPRGYYEDTFDYDSLRSCLLEPFKNNSEPIYKTAVYDFKTETMVEQEPKTAESGSILLMEGVFLLRPELADYWDYSIFLHVDFEQVIARAKIRDQYLFGEEEIIEKRYRDKYIPGQQIYLKEADPFCNANIVVNNNDYNSPKIMKCEKETEKLRKRALEFI